MIHRSATFFGKPMVVACDAKCGKAWGHNGDRPRIAFAGEADPDDYAYLADHEVGEAPEDPGTYEGGQGKPQRPDQRLNRWCVRECERSASAPSLDEIRLPDFDRRLYNIPSRHPEAAQSSNPGT